MATIIELNYGPAQNSALGYWFFGHSDGWLILAKGIRITTGDLQLETGNRELGTSASTSASAGATSKSNPKYFTQTFAARKFT